MKLKLNALAAAAVITTSTWASEWTGNESDDWFDAANWSAGVPTASTNSVRISTASPYSTVIDGGSAATGSSFGVGHNGPGELSLINGASLVSESASLGNQSAGAGSVTISGQGSSWQVASGNFDVGGSGGAQLEIVHGGLLQTPSSLIRIGQMASGTGSVLIDGAGSIWDHQNNFWLGVSGSGQMTISNGGEMVFFGTSTLGQTGNASGELLITGAASILSGTRLHVGNGSTSGTTLATGLLQLVEGGTLELAGPAGSPPENYRLIIASNSRSEGTVNVGAPAGEPPAAPGQLDLYGGISFNNGDGTLVFNHTGILEMDFPVVGPANGSAHIQAENGTTLFSAQSFDYSGSLAIEENAVFGAGGQLGDVVNEGTLVASPGQSTTLAIDGDYTHGETAVLEIQFSPGPTIDLVSVSGQAELNGGGVRIHVLPGNYGNITLDGLYPILFAEGGRSGEFDQVITTNPNALSLIYDGDTVYLEVSDQLHRDRYEDD